MTEIRVCLLTSKRQAECVYFTIPSAAVVAAGNTNGRLSWRIFSTNQTYADWHEAQLPKEDEQEIATQD